MNHIQRRRDLETKIGERDPAGDQRADPSHVEHQSAGAPHEHGAHGSHSRWMMIACCIPMLLIALALVVTGVVSPGFLLVALLCVGMMALMMGGMSHGQSNTSSHRH